MKIVFLCGSLEPGLDGVGDYTRRLVGELIRQSHQAAVVALNDQHLTKEISGTQNSEGIDLPVLRVPSAWPAKHRFERAKEWIDELAPEWLSLQFVPFSFHAKGLPFGVSRLLTNLGKGKRWHIMFHELWVGMNVESPIKHVLWGWLQKQLIKSLICSLRPNVIQTQARLYQAQLCKIGFDAGYLPLFANIPTVSIANTSSVEEHISLKHSEGISFVIFGAIHPGAPVREFAKEVSLYAKKKGKKISLTLIGRCGDEQKHWTTEFRSVGVAIERLGEQPPERISEVLGNASMGISTTSLAVIEKSGSVAAMREHGLPVLCVARHWRPRGAGKLKPPSGIFEYRNGNFEVCLANAQNFPLTSYLRETSRQFIDTLLAND